MKMERLLTKREKVIALVAFNCGMDQVNSMIQGSIGCFTKEEMFSMCAQATISKDNSPNGEKETPHD